MIDLLSAWLDLQRPVIIAILGVYGILVLATLIVAALKARTGNPQAELQARITSWWVMVTVFAVAVFIHQPLAAIFLGLLSYLALKEYFSMIPTRKIDRVVLLLAYLAVPVQFWFAYRGEFGLFIVFIPVWMFLLLPTVMAIKGETSGYIRSVGTVSWGLMMTVFTLSHMAYLLFSGDQANPIAGGAGLLFFLVFIAQFNDVAQFTWGKLFGKHKIAPNVSPKKTWEGFLGGAATSVVLAAIIGPYLTPMDMSWAALSGGIIAVSGFLGDITESAVKRDLGVKDAGQLIPGHGGILDRVDSLMYSAPVFTHFFRYFFYP
jgi:phosphatidate cytidylyltransferase